MLRLLGVLAYLVVAITCAAAKGAPRPNIIYIMTDDLGYGDLGCYGQQVIVTPHIDRLAEGGLRFTDHYAGHTVCRPSRLVLWSGLHTGHTPIDDNAPYTLQTKDVTVAERLKAAGYATGCVGKWALGDISNTGHPNRKGFDYFFGYLDQSAAHNYYPPYLWRNMEQVELPGNQLGEHKNVSSKKVTYSHDVITDDALEFIRRHGREENPFLLHIHWTIPHTNNEAGRVEGDGQEVPDYGRYADRDWPNPEKGFAAMVTRMDGDVGRIVSLVGELGIEKETLILFTSDNGPHQEGGHKVDFFDSNGALRGHKRDLYDGGIRVPMIAYWPGTIEPGTTTDHPSAFWDWMPTACELAGVAPPDVADGISYGPILLGQPTEQKQHEYLYWSRGGIEAVRAGSWKAVRPGKGRPVELYDLRDDIGEQHDLAARHTNVLQQLTAMMQAARNGQQRP
ncbi:MAG TPA: arylsulfatase [Pirellulaceae bacterium]|nr:arylsulfatase [Pirellulaceae bacterium]